MASNGGFIPYSRGRFCTATAATGSGGPVSGRFWKQGPEEGPLITREAARFLDEGDGLQDIRVGHGVLAVLFVGRKAREAEHRKGNIALPLRWQKIAVMSAAKSRHQLQPHLRVSFELSELPQRDFVSEMTGDHVRAAPASEAADLYHNGATA